ncbi:uncharacterized protein LOC100368071 [Saccoglossus kowalevskii]|uniref:Uncharacterized protein LOC100368071 n=1 Tax=Saccoglossus kowalevskii TaxID=10224 RepID=A0ABM0GPH8_SACKO|nr:PREDICTED: uncharacterized protein LOC100368071 [Saccoglossus kowalevskii]
MATDDSEYYGYYSVRNPDEDFVLHGQTATVREKPTDYLSNSQKTMTTRALSQNTMYNPDNYRPSSRTYNADRLDEFSLDFSGLNGGMNRSLSKSVSFRDRRDDDVDDYEEELQRLIERSSRQEQAIDDILVGRSLSHGKRQWFTQPIHLTKSSEYPVFQSAGLDVSDTRKSDRDSGALGTNLAARKLISESFVDHDARKSYPVTLGNTLPNMYRTFSPPPSLKPSRSRSLPVSSRSTHRPKSAFVASDPRLRASNDYYYLKAAEPSLMKSDVIASPYEYELAKLRMQKLRLEEEKLLEVKRQLELERIRGPTPKWYEMKGPQFHYEAKKNNDLLQKKDEWNNLFEYRKELLRSSREFSKSQEY